MYSPAMSDVQTEVPAEVVPEPPAEPETLVPEGETEDSRDMDPYGYREGEPGYVYTAEPTGGPPNENEEIRKLQ